MATLEERLENLNRAFEDSRYDSGTKLAAIESTMRRFSHALRLWHELEDIPMNPETECLDEPFEPTDAFKQNTIKRFPAGTSKYDIWEWFERYFKISVAEAFFGEDPKGEPIK